MILIIGNNYFNYIEHVPKLNNIERKRRKRNLHK